MDTIKEHELIKKYWTWRQGRLTLSQQEQQELKRSILEELKENSVSPETLRKKASARFRFLRWLDSDRLT